MDQENNIENHTAGIWYAFAAYTAWGVLPVYWKVLQSVPAMEILAHRIFWSFIFVTLIILISQRVKDFKAAFFNKKVWLSVLPCALLISINWGTYIWAVNANHVVEASMGYYINPLFSVLLALLILRERLNFWQYISLGLAFAGVVIITLQYGKVPWIALTLAISFGLYGLFKKMAKLDSIIGLTFETIILVPIAFTYIFVSEYNHVGALGSTDITIVMFLVFSGIATAMPLLWFAQAANRIPLSLLGFIQYLSPSISLFLGVVVYKEAFTHVHLISFAFIWLALILFSFSKTAFMENLHVNITKNRAFSDR